MHSRKYYISGVLVFVVGIMTCFWFIYYFTDKAQQKIDMGNAKNAVEQLPVANNPETENTNEPVIVENPNMKLLVVNGDQLYYTSIIGKTLAIRLGKYLARDGLFTKDDKILRTKIDKQARKYIFSIVINKEAVDDKDIESDALYYSQALYMEVFEFSDRVEVQLCDDDFNVLKTVNKIE